MISNVDNHVENQNGDIKNVKNKARPLFFNRI
ncbi:hypothetical protein KCTC52924_03548 [Arenibacter antarcticus]